MLGAMIGFQRERAHRPAGLRTHILIAAGAALFTVLSGLISPDGDPTRVAAGIVTGIGFLGAGTILHRSRFVEGLTTAASIWVTAAIGMAAGSGHYILAAISTVIAFLVLLIPHPGEKDHKDS